MFDLRSNLYPMAFLQNDYLIFNHHFPFSLENIKELSGPFMIVHNFRASRRDTFLDHAHIIALKQMPAITDLTPDIVFRIFDGNDHTTQAPRAVRDVTNSGIFSILAQIFYNRPRYRMLLINIRMPRRDSLFRSTCKRNIG